MKTGWEKIFAIPISNERLYTEYTEISYNLNNKKPNKLVKMDKRFADTSQKKICSWPISTWKDAQHHQLQGKCKLKTNHSEGYPWWFSGRDFVLPLQGIWVWCLVGELRSHMLPCGQTRKKKFTMTDHYILLCSLKLNSDNTKSWPECGATGTLSEKVRHVNTLGNILAILKINWAIYLPYESFLGLYPREKETMYPYQDLYTNVPPVLFTTVLNRKQRSYSRTLKGCSEVQCYDGMLIRDPEEWTTDRATNMNFQKYFKEQTKPGSKD